MKFAHFISKIFLLLFLSIALYPSSTKALEPDTLSAIIQDALIKTDRLYHLADYEQAASEAELAYELSELESDEFGMALALQKEAFALLKIPRKLKANRKKAKAKLEQSLLYLDSPEHNQWRKKNLKGLKEIAERNGDYQEAALHQKQIDLIDEANTTQMNLAEETENLRRAQEQLDNTNQILDEKNTELDRYQLESRLLIARQKNRVDSLEYLMQVDSLILAQNDIQLKEQAANLRVEKTKKYIYILGFILVIIIAIGVYMRYKESKNLNQMLAYKNEVIEEERKKSDQLLLNILPNTVANELKQNGAAEARKYNQATVLFSDFINFTTISGSMSPEDLVKLLHEYFTLFDQIIEKHGLEKIKTIGDAYMCVGGLPDENSGNPIDVINAAIEIQSKLDDKKQAQKDAGLPYFEARIGIHTGPLVAGVVGAKKFAFDIWGDTVNVAARLESTSEAGKVNISASTFKLVEGNFDCTSRGKLPIKNRGEIEMFFVDRSKSIA